MRLPVCMWQSRLFLTQRSIPMTILIMDNYTLQREAAMRGERTFQGTICLRNHDGTRYTASGACVQCMKDRARAKHQAIRELLMANEKTA